MNEEHQLRYGLGQVLDYMDEANEAGHVPEGVLFVNRPPRRMTWMRKCRDLNIQLCWPGPLAEKALARPSVPDRTEWLCVGVRRLPWHGDGWRAGTARADPEEPQVPG